MKKHQKTKEEYDKNPKKCKECEEDVPYNKKQNKFCSHSCSATHNNKGVTRNFSTGKYATKKCINCQRKTINAKYCSCSCHQEYQWKEYKKEVKKNKKFINSSSPTIKKYLKEENGNKCEICGGDEWCGKPMPLVLDHENGNPYDDRVNNLRLICGNCDMLLPTYKGKNRGNGRHERRNRYKNGQSY